MRWSAVVRLASLAAVFACGNTDEPHPPPELEIRINGSVAQSVTVCFDGSDTLGTTLLLSNPSSDQSFALSLFPSAQPERSASVVRVEPPQLTLAPNESKAARVDVAGIPPGNGFGSSIGVVIHEDNGAFPDVSFGVAFVVDERLIELSLVEPAGDGAPRLLVFNPTPLGTEVSLFSQGRWRPEKPLHRLFAHDSVVVPLFKTEEVPLPTGDAASITVRGKRCSSRRLPESTLVIRRGSLAGVSSL
jgi:hypothetical protein